MAQHSDAAGLNKQNKPTSRRTFRARCAPGLREAERFGIIAGKAGLHHKKVHLIVHTSKIILYAIALSQAQGLRGTEDGAVDRKQQARGVPKVVKHRLRKGACGRLWATGKAVQRG